MQCALLQRDPKLQVTWRNTPSGGRRPCGGPSHTPTPWPPCEAVGGSGRSASLPQQEATCPAHPSGPGALLNRPGLKEDAGGPGQVQQLCPQRARRGLGSPEAALPPGSGVGVSAPDSQAWAPFSASGGGNPLLPAPASLSHCLPGAPKATSRGQLSMSKPRELRR